MKYVNGNFHNEVENDEYIIHISNECERLLILRHTGMPRSLKKRYELMNQFQVKASETVTELDGGVLQLLAKSKGNNWLHAWLGKVNEIRKREAVCWKWN